MYHEHFGLDRAPFRITPDTDLFYPGGGRGEVLEALVYAVESGEGIVKVVGEVGTGKTMLCRMLETRLPGTVEVVYLANPSLEPDEILHAFALEMSLPVAPEAGRLQVLHALHERLLAKHAAGRRVVALVEEAQSMPIATLEEIRLLSNLETQRDKLLQIVLFGQPELDLSLERPEIRQLRERITHSFYLQPFTREQVREYVNHRLRAVGYRGPDVFRDGAYASMNRASEGLTRRVNILADKALLAAFADDTHSVQRRHVRIAIDDSRFDRQKRRVRGIGLALVVLAVIAAVTGAAYYRYPGGTPAWLARWWPPGTRAPAVPATGVSGPGSAPAPAAASTAASPASATRAGPGGAAGVARPAAKPLQPAPAPPQAAVSSAAAPLATPPVRATGSQRVQADDSAHRRQMQVTTPGVAPASAKSVAAATATVATAAHTAAAGTGAPPAVSVVSRASGVAAQGGGETPVEHPPVPATSPAGTAPPAQAPSTAGPAPVAKPAPPAAPAQTPARAPSATTGTATTSVAGGAPAAGGSSSSTPSASSKTLQSATASAPAAVPVLVPLSAVSPDNALLYSRVQATREWLKRVDPAHFSIQLLLADVSHQANLESFLQRVYKNGDIDKVYVYETTIGARTWFGLLYGEYPSFTAAQAALQALPAALKHQKPFIRDVRDIAALH